MNGSIVIDKGVVNISPELLAEFPNLQVSVAGGVVSIAGVDKEQFIRIAGDNIFWANTQKFDSYAMLFDEDNYAEVAELSSGIVKYVNAKGGDYSISVPDAKTVAIVKTLRDPLGLGIAIDYRGALGEYANGKMTLQELSKKIEIAYMYLLGSLEIDAEEIESALSSIDIADIATLLDSTISIGGAIQSTIDSVNSNTNGSTSVSVASLDGTAEIVADEAGLSKVDVCLDPDDVASSTVDAMLDNASTSLSQSVLESMSADQFKRFCGVGRENALSDVLIANITTTGLMYATVVWVPEHTEIVDTNFTEELRPPKLFIEILTRRVDGVVAEPNANLGAELLIGILNLAGGTEIDWEVKVAGAVYDNVSSIGTLTVDGNANIFSITKKVMDEAKVGGEQTEASLYIEPTILKYSVEDVPKNLCERVKTAYVGLGGKLELAYAFPMIETIYNRGRVVFKDKTFYATIFGNAFLGTTLKTKVTTVVTDNINESIRFLRMGIANIRFATVADIGWGHSWGSITNNVLTLIAGVSLLSKHYINFYRAGITAFDRLHIVGDVGVEDIALIVPDIFVAVPPKGYLPIFKNTQVVSSSEGWLTSKYEEGSSYKNKYLGYIKDMCVNGMPISSTNSVASLLAGVKDIQVSSTYAMRQKDLDSIADIMKMLRDGYLRHFRTSNSTVAIKKENNKHSYASLREAYDTVFSSYDNVRTLASGESLTFENGLGNSYDLSLEGISKHGINALAGVAGVEEFKLLFSDDTVEVGVEAPTVHAETHYRGYVEKDGVYTIYRATRDYIDDTGRANLYYYTSTIDTIADTVTNESEPYKIKLDVEDGTLFEDNFKPLDSQPNPAYIIPTDARVEYKITQDSEGVVVVKYTAYDKDDNDITDSFNTVSLGDKFLIKEME